MDYKSLFSFLIMLTAPPVSILSLIYSSTTNNINILPNTISLQYVASFYIYSYLSIFLSSQKFIGPINVDNVKPIYANNGFTYWVTTSFITMYICENAPHIPLTFFKNFIPITIISSLFGISLVVYLYFSKKDNYFDKEKDDELNYSNVFRFYRGLEFHPTLNGVDIKQWTNCRIGMMGWQVIMILFLYYSIYTNQFSHNLLATVVMQSAYIAKFFYWETGYFNTLDITLDRAGFYICWGCTGFLPIMYTFTTYYICNNPGVNNVVWSFLCFCFGIFFLFKNYEVDYQKELFKKFGDNTIINNKSVKYLNVQYLKNGEMCNSKLLISGHWGYCRHSNYFYELLMTLCWSLVRPDLQPIVFTYFIYLFLLLIHRIYRDEDKCKNKYKNGWDEYCKIVPYRLIKHLY